MCIIKIPVCHNQNKYTNTQTKRTTKSRFSLEKKVRTSFRYMCKCTKQKKKILWKKYLFNASVLNCKPGSILQFFISNIFLLVYSAKNSLFYSFITAFQKPTYKLLYAQKKERCHVKQDFNGFKCGISMSKT